MKKDRSLYVLLALALVLILLLVGAYFLYGRLSREVETDQLSVHSRAPQTEEPDQAEDPAYLEESQQQEDTDLVAAPDFTAYDREGNAVSLSDYLGKPVVLNFWASWCGPCQSEMPGFDDAYGELGEEIQFLMVNLTGGRETVDSASGFIDEQGYTFPVLYDTDGEASAVYGVYSIPATYFIDGQGYAIAHAIGAIDRDTLQEGIDMIWTDQEGEVHTDAV